MIPESSFYASQMKYDNDQKDWVKSSTPLYLKEIYSSGYLFKENLLVNIPTKSINEKFGEIVDFKITKKSKFGLLTKENNGYKYAPNYIYKTNNNLDSFSYSFDIKDGVYTINKVEFKVDIQLSKYIGFKLNSNENRMDENFVGPYSIKLRINGQWGKITNIGKFNKETLKPKNKDSQLGFNFIGDSFYVYGFNGN